MKTSINCIPFSAVLVIFVLLAQSIYLTGQITFEETEQIGSGAGRVDAIQLEDMNNDGLIDLVLMNAGQSQFAPESEMFFIYHQLSTGTYSETPDVSFFYQGSYTEEGFEVYDINFDGLKDIVHLGQSSVLIAYQEPLGVFTYMELATESYSNAVAVGDFNTDGKADIASVGTSKLNIFLQGEDNVFELTEYQLSNGFPEQLITSDVNNDGFDDLLSGGQIFKDTLFLFLQSPSGTFSTPITVPTSNNVFTVGNFNDDPYADLAIFGSFEDSIEIWHWNNDTLNFIKENALPVFQHVSSLEVADFNCDGYLDLVAPTSGWQNISVYPGSPFGFAAYISNHSSNSQTFPNALALGDMNNDNFVDIAIGRNAFWGGEFLYGNSKPLLGDYEIVDTVILVTEIEGDTTNLFDFFSISMIDTSGECFLNITDSFHVTTTLIKGMQIVTQREIALEAAMCGVSFTDTIVTTDSEFFDSETVDTIFVGTSVDTLVTEEIIIEETLVDTLDLGNYSDSLFFITIDTVTNLDTIFYIVDSLAVVSEYELVGNLTCDITITETSSCNVSAFDTSKITQTLVDTFLIEVDTVFISRNTTFTIVSAVQEWSSSQSVITFPNPSFDFIHLETPLELRGRTITFHLFNIQGQRIDLEKESVNDAGQEIIFDVSVLAEGEYVLVLHSDHLTFNARFIRISN